MKIRFFYFLLLKMMILLCARGEEYDEGDLRLY